MNAIRPLHLPEPLAIVATLASLLQLLERGDAAPAPGQYRELARRLEQALAAAPAGPVLDAVLDTFPAAGECYENLQYAHAGLCRAPLEASLNSELAARAAIDKASAKTAGA